MKIIKSICKLTIIHLKILSQDQYKYILIGVKGGGCNGLKYYIEPTNDKPLKRDELINIDNLNIIICGKSIMHLIGCHIYWKQDTMGSRIEFNNPNAKTKCGCGDTFSV